MTEGTCKQVDLCCWHWKPNGINDQNRKFAFETELRKAVPDLMKLRSNWGQSYLKQPAPHTGGTVTIAQVVHSSIQSGNMKCGGSGIGTSKANANALNHKRNKLHLVVHNHATCYSTTWQKVPKMSDSRASATANFQAGKPRGWVPTYQMSLMPRW